MLYKFKCKAAADLVMLGPQGDELLRLMGREPTERGIIEVAAVPAAMAALDAAVLRSEQPQAPGAAPAARADDHAADQDGTDQDVADAPQAVSLRQRAWPMREMLRRAHEEQQPVVWGV
jgi:hypothetical protein